MRYQQQNATNSFVKFAIGHESGCDSISILNAGNDERLNVKICDIDLLIEAILNFRQQLSQQ